jgi:hypothetical protein
LLLDCLQEGKCRTRNDGRPSNQKKMMKIVLNMKCASLQTKEIKLIERQQKNSNVFFCKCLPRLIFLESTFPGTFRITEGIQRDIDSKMLTPRNKVHLLFCIKCLVFADGCMFCCCCVCFPRHVMQPTQERDAIPFN